MAINYTWDCKTVDVKTIDGNEDTVFNVHWRLTGIDDVNNDENGNSQTCTFYGSQSLDTSDLSGFTAFADLTTEQVTDWTIDAIGEDEVQAKKDSIAVSIAEKVTPIIQTKTIGE